MKKLRIINAVMLAITTLAVQAPAYSYSSVEEYVKTELNELVDRYHITSQAQIERNKIGGEGAQVIYSMAISPLNSKKMLLGNNISGVYRSENGGEFWEPSGNGLGFDCIDTVAYDPDDEDTAYAVVATSGSSKARVNYSDVKLGVYKSTDGGRTWNYKLRLCNERSIGRLIAFGRKQNGTRYMFAGSSKSDDYADSTNPTKGSTGLWRSADKGETWECIGFEQVNVVNLYCDPDTDMLLVSHTGGLSVSYDNGSTFKSINGDLPYPNVSAATVDPADKQHITAGVRVKENGAYKGAMLYESKDGGSTWKRTNSSNSAWYKDSAATTYIASLDYAYVNGTDKPPRLFMAIYNQNYPNRYSDDYGATFTNCVFKIRETYGLRDDYPGWFALPFCIDPQDPSRVFTSIITPMKSTDGGETFEFSGSGYSGYLDYDIYFDKNGAVKYMPVTDLGFVRMSPEEGTIYSPCIGKSSITLPDYVTAESSTSVAVDPKDETHGFVTMGGYVYGTPTTVLETTDGFKSFHPINSFDSLNSVNRKTLRWVRYDPDNSNVLYTDYYVSEDNGKTWRMTEHPISGISNFDGDTVYSFDNSDITITTAKVYISHDRGRTWQDTGIGPLNKRTSNAKFQAICVDNMYPDVLWAADWSVIYRIDIANGKVTAYDGPETGILGTTANRRRIELTKLVQNPEYGSHMLISGRDINGGGSHVFETFDYGKSWHRLDCFPYLAYEFPIAFHPTEKVTFFGGVMGNFIYKWGKVEWNLTGQSTTSGAYDAAAEKYRLRGMTDPSYAGRELTLTINDAGGETQVYKTKAENNGAFAFEAVGIVPDGGYDISVATDLNKAYYSGSFNASWQEQPSEEPEIQTEIDAVYSAASHNLVVVGKIADKKNLSLLVKDINEDASEINADNFDQAVIHIAEITPNSGGSFVYKAKMNLPNGKTIKDYELRVLANGTMYESVPIREEEHEYSAAITINDNDTVDFTPGAEFTVNAGWRYFTNDRLDCSLYAAAFNEQGRLIQLFKSDKAMDFVADECKLTGIMTEDCAELRVLLWSDMKPLRPVKIYKK